MERDRVEITVPFDKEIFENSNREFWLMDRALKCQCKVQKSNVTGRFRTRSAYRLTGTGSPAGSLTFGGLLAARSATRLCGGTSVYMLLAAVCSLASVTGCPRLSNWLDVPHPRSQSLQSIWSAGRLSALVTVTTGCREIHDIHMRMSIKIDFYCACSVLEKLTTRNEGFYEETHPKLMETPRSKGR